MSNYVKATNFTAKDSLLTGNPSKIIKGAEIDDEFNAISTAIATKPDSNSPTFTGIPVAPTAAASTNTTQIATTAFVTAFANTLGTMSIQNKTAVDITGGTIVGITDLTVADGGTGVSTIAANAVVLGNGTSAIQTVAPGTSGNLLKSNGTTWVSAAGGILINTQYFTASGTYTPTAGTNFVIVEVVGGGGGVSAGGGTSSFGAFCSATGGGGGNPGGGGIGIGGDINAGGGSGGSSFGNSIGNGGSSAFGYGGGSSGAGNGYGGGGSNGYNGGGGGGGGGSRKKITSSFSGTLVTIGAGGNNGTAGIVIVYEYA